MKKILAIDLIDDFSGKRGSHILDVRNLPLAQWPYILYTNNTERAVHPKQASRADKKTSSHWI